MRGNRKWKSLPGLLAVLLMVGALACGAAADEYRGFAVTGWSSGFLKQSEVDKLLGVPGVAGSKGDIRNANCNAVFVEVRRRADVCYPSALGEPYMSGLSPANFNALQAIINAAHDTTGGKQRIEVHAWMVVFATTSPNRTPSSVYYAHNNPADPENYWVTLDESGAETDDKALDPGHPKCEEYIVDVCMDLVNNFDMDGIHFDYIRFTGADQGYNPTSIARYNARYLFTGQPESGDEQFKQWRRDQVSAVVRKVYAKIQAVKPGVKLSGSFVGGTPSPTVSTRDAFKTTKAYDQVYSDWDSWLQEGIVDMAMPMCYFDDDVLHDNYVNWLNFAKDRKANRLVVITPGLYLNYLQDAINQTLLIRDPSPSGNYAAGFNGYSYQSPYVITKGSDPVYGAWTNFSPQFVSQVTPTWADVPDRPWKTNPSKGLISGTIRYTPDSAWADGASVRITGPETRQMLCDGTGFYAFVDLTPGTYTVRANYAQYEEQKTVVVQTDAVATGDFNLSTIDNTAPVVSNVQIASVSDGGAVITWTSDEPATSQVEYDMVPYYGQSSAHYQALLTDHSRELQGLTPNTTYHLRIKSINGAGLTGYSGDFVFTTGPAVSSIIVDEADLNWTSTGSWITSTSAYGWNGGYKYASCTNGSATATCTWTPTLLRSGPYDISIYYRKGSNRASDAAFTINHANGSTQVTVNQSGTGEQWESIRTNVQFNIGTEGNVSLGNRTGNTLPKVVVADAVRFEYKGDITPPVMSSVTDDRYTASTTSLQASWSGSDAQSGIGHYKYAVGTQPGIADVKAWTDAGTATSAVISGLSLTVGRTYYISARAVNGAGLTSVPVTSSGVTVARTVTSTSQAKSYADGEPLYFSAISATAKYPTAFYIEDSSRASGLRVESTASVSRDQIVQVYGILGLVNGCERALTDCKVITGSIGDSVRPLGMPMKSLGGNATGDAGLGNVGLLTRIAGKVTSVVSDGFYLDDGSGLTDETGNKGVKIWTGVPNSAVVDSWKYVTGVVSCRAASGKLYPLVLARDVNGL